MTNKEIVKAWYVAMDALDANTLRGLMDSKFQGRNPFDPGPIGGEEYIAMAQGIISSFEGAEHRIETMVGEGDYIAVSARWLAKHTGDFNGIPATGNILNVPFITMFKIVNGKVVSLQVEFNPATMMAQVGASNVNA